MMQEEHLLDPEEQTEQKLVNSMAWVIVAMVAALILILALRPWLQRYRAEQEKPDLEGVSPEIDAGMGR